MCKVLSLGPGTKKQYVRYVDKLLIVYCIYGDTKKALIFLNYVQPVIV